MLNTTGSQLTAQLYVQQFNTIQTPLSGTSLTTAPYCSPAPNNTQLTSIASNGPGAVFEVNSAGKLVMSRSADVAVFTRAADFNPIPSTEIWKFDISISGNTTAQTNGAKFLTGFDLGIIPFGEESDAGNIRGRIGLNWTANEGEFSFRNAANTASTANFTGEQTVVWLQNNSGATVSYMAPDGSVATLNAGFEDLWVGTTLVFNETPAVNSARTLRRIKFILNAGSATVSLDNILVSPITPAPTATASQTVCGVVNPTLANLSATGTDLKWYSAATGGSTLPLSTPITNGSVWYVSQTQNGIESVRTALTALLTSVSVDNNIISADQTICSGTIPSGLTGLTPSVTGGTGSFAYAWEISSASASTGFSSIAGATSQDLALSSSLTANRWYRRRVTADGCISFSNVVAITVTAANTGNTVTVPAAAACAAVAAASISASLPAGGSGVFTYQWESSTVGSAGPFSSVPSSNTQNLAPGILTQTTWFRRIVNSGACAASTSNVVQYNVNQPILDNDASGAQTICTGSTPTLINGTIPGGGNGTSYTYTWQLSSALNGPYTNITTGGSAQNYQPPALTGTTFYRRQVTSGSCAATFSDTVQVTVNPVITSNTISPAATQNVCSANIPPAFTGSIATGGNGSISYQWQSSTTSSSAGFSDIPGETSQSYAPGLLSQTTWFRRVVTAGVCPASVTASVQYSVTSPIANNDASPVNSPICINTIPEAIQGSLPTGGSGTYTYLWESTTVLPTASWSAATSTTSNTQQNFSRGSALGVNIWYRRRVSSGFCPATFSDTIAVLVNPVITSNTISPAATQNVCSANIPPAFTGSLATGGNGSISYQWQSSTTSSSSGFSDIPGETSQSYAPGLLSQTTWFRRVVTAGVCPASTTAAVQYTVTQPILNNDASGAQLVCTGTALTPISGSLPSGGNGTSFAYVWQSSSALNGTYSNISGATAQNYTPPATTGTFFYRRQVTSGSCPATFSDTIQITVNPVISSNTITPNTTQNVCSANIPPGFTGSLATGGNGSMSYQWQSSTTSSSSGFSDIPGETSQSYAPGLLSQTTWFRRVVTAGVCPPSFSAAVQYSVTTPITNNDATPITSPICVTTIPEVVPGSLPSGGTGTFSYQWEQNTSFPSASWTNATGTSNQQNYTRGQTLPVNIWLRRRVTSGFCPVTYSDTISIQVNSTLGSNSISNSTTPNVCSAFPAPDANGNAPSGGTGPYNIQWELSTTNATSGFSAIPGANAQNYSPGLLSQNTWFRRVISAGVCPSVTSNVLAYSVTQPILNNDASGGPQNICSGTIPAPLSGSLPTGGNGVFAYVWESASALSGPYSNVSGATAQNYAPPALTSSRWYRRRVTSGFCPVTYSDTIQVTVTPAISTNTISLNGNNSTICQGFTPPNQLSGSVPTGGIGTYEFQWESSVVGSTGPFTEISGATAQTLSTGPILTDTWFRRRVVSGVCTSFSSALKFTVNLPVTNNNAGIDQQVCPGTVPDTIRGSVPSGGTGVYSNLWLVSTAGPSGPFSTTFVTSLNYLPNTISNNTWFVRRVSSGVCPPSFSDTVFISIFTPIANNVVSSAQVVCDGNLPQPLTGSLPTGGSGIYTYEWEVSTTGATSGFTIVPGQTGQGISIPAITDTVWYRRIVYSGNCKSTSAAVILATSPNPIVNAGPAIPDMIQGGISDTLGGFFGGSAKGAIWTATEGSFFNNTGLNPADATFKASLTSSAVVTLTLTTFGGPCGTASASKTVNVAPDPNGITGVVNYYGEVVAPATLSVGALVCTLAAGQGAGFAKNDRALLIQMKGVSVSLPSSPTAVTYGYITGMGNAGNHEFLFIDSVAGDVIFFRRCIKKNYTISASVQLVKVPVYNGNYNVKSSSTVSAIRLARRGMGYPPNSTITSGFTITPVQGGTGLQIEAKTNSLGQIFEVNVLDPGSGYLKPPLISMPDPTEPPYDFPAYKAKADAIMGLTAKQWNGKIGGILCMEVNGNLVLNDSINMEGMGFAGGMIGDRGDIAPLCGASAEFSLPFSSFERSGQKGEGIAVIPPGNERGRGRYGTGGGGGVEPEGGGGGGANWQDGGRGGGSSYVVIPLSACSLTVTPCDNDAERGGLGGGTNPTIPVTNKNVLRSNSYYYLANTCRIFLGGGGGGGHSFNFSRGLQTGGAGGYGGGIVILKGNNLRSNGMKIKANGLPGEDANQDGAGGGGAGGAVIIDFDGFTGNVNARVNGGRGGNSLPQSCDDPGDGSYPIRYRYFGAGGGGGGGVVWFSQPDIDVNFLTAGCELSQSSQGTNGDFTNNLASQGGSSRSQSELVFIENLPYLGSTFTVGGTSPKPNFPNLAKAAEFLAFNGTDAAEVTLLITPNTTSQTALSWYKDQAIFKPIFTPACQVGDASLVLRSSNLNPVNLRNEVDDLQYLVVDGLPKITLRNLTISSSTPDVSTNIIVKNGSRLVLDNVAVNADVNVASTGSNELELVNTNHQGNVTVGANQKVKIEGSLVTMNGDAANERSLSLGAGSKFYLGSGKTLDLKGVSWNNDGADSVVIDPSATLRLSGNFQNQTIGGLAPSIFEKLDITSSGKITINTGPTVGDWNQTGSATINTTNQVLTIGKRVTSGSGSFTTEGFGRVQLNSNTNKVEVSGFYANLEMASAAGARVAGQVNVSQNLLLSVGKLESDSVSAKLFLENPDPFSLITFGNQSWIHGILNRRVSGSGLYSFPIGNKDRLENMAIKFNSVSGGLDNLDVKFISSDPHFHPVTSVILPFSEGAINLREILPGGYWKVKPNAGSANYDVWLYPSFFGTYPQFSIMKREENSNEWNVTGSLDNPENTISFVQSDGSVRRTGSIGFSDFAVAGGEDPLPLKFLDFRVRNQRGLPLLNWRMAECAEGTRYHLWRGASRFQLEKTGQYLDGGRSDCQKEFSYLDENAGIPLNTLYYRIEAEAPGEIPALSEIRSFSPSGDSEEKPWLAVVPESGSAFKVMGAGLNQNSIAVYSADGRLLDAGLRADNRILDLRKLPRGLYFVELEQNGVKFRQRVVLRE